MYKIMIVEDEWLVLQGLKMTIPWSEMRCSIIAEAGDGVTALERIQVEQPDILLTDIRMPAMDGIQLAEKVSQQWPQVKIVFLTGFDDFAYAQKAVKLGAVDFVLKPTNPEELIGVIGRITAKLDEERKVQLLQEQRERRYGWEQPLILEKMLYDVMLDFAGTMEKEWLLEYGREMIKEKKGELERELPESKQDLQETEQDLQEGITSSNFSSFSGSTATFASTDTLTYVPYRVMVVQLDGLPEAVLDHVRLRELLEEQLGELTALPSIRIQENRYALIVNRLKEREEIAHFLEQILLTQPTLADNCLIGVSLACTGMDSLSAAYQQAMSALYQTVFLGRERVIWFDDAEGTQNPNELSPSIMLELVELVKWGSLESIHDNIRLWYKELLQRYSDGLDMRRRFYEFMVMLYSLLLRDNELRGIVLDSEFLLASAKRVEEPLEQSLHRLIATLSEWNRQYTEQADSHKKSGFEDIEAFIQQHYAEDITLQGIAERHHMSESHFSRLFKKQVGTSFLEYLTLIRVRQAKELLTNPRLKIYEVSVQVGYQDSRYFSQIFRKYTGETPTEFRKRLGIENVPF
ncbi:response regulator [Paenibacillus eucommiae]|uniref:Two-component system response regulator YesN n=1 Tax=Paenibacillus eucommiae TaxID=1355755 RepID=A0ABS4J907_9BACL|nr:response regulator [Paenibacillus eucommiae]MBP1995561.1 two-component system response regulator YesN [Paenibacillus eucommiae]